MFQTVNSANSLIPSGNWGFPNLASLFPFQINQDKKTTATKIAGHEGKTILANFNASTLIEIIGVFLVFALFASTVTPGVNESHYLTKAKHFWNPNWCPGDLFLESADAHFVFFLVCGWPTLFLSLDAVAWIGRIACWLCFSGAWIYLNRVLSVRFGLSVCSAALFILLVNRFDMAGEWVVGGFEAKSVAYIFVLLAIGLFLEGKMIWCLPTVGAVIAIHAVVGGWTLVCLAGAVCIEAIMQRSWPRVGLANGNSRATAISVAVFLSLLALGCFPAMFVNSHASLDVVSAANEIQVHHRLRHHLLFGGFSASHVARFAIQVSLWLVLTRVVFVSSKFQLLSWFVHSSLFVSLVGLILSGAAENHGPYFDQSNSLLRFYWFRFSDFAIPLGLSILFAKIAGPLVDSNSSAKRTWSRFSLVCLLAATLLAVSENHFDRRPAADKATLPTYVGDKLRTNQTQQNWRKVCIWIRKNTRSDSVVVTPLKQQTFKWYAHRPEFVCWKDAPQDAANLIQWQLRINIVRNMEHAIGGSLGMTDQLADQMFKEFGVTHILLPQSTEDQIKNEGSSGVASNLVKIYPVDSRQRSTYVVYKLLAD